MDSRSDGAWIQVHTATSAVSSSLDPSLDLRRIVTKTSITSWPLRQYAKPTCEDRPLSPVTPTPQLPGEEVADSRLQTQDSDSSVTIHSVWLMTHDSQCPPCDVDDLWIRHGGCDQKKSSQASKRVNKLSVMKVFCNRLLTDLGTQASVNKCPV